jgi:chitin disaccharide deacetylase
MTLKKIIICADDFGQNAEISKGIIELVRNQRISAVSCLVNSKDFNFYAEQLKAFADKIDIGLHFDLTSNHNLGILLIKSKLHLLRQIDIEAEFNRQLDIFLKIFGKSPDFIDGHQHVHHLPVICDAIFNIYIKRLKDQKPYIRYVNYEKLNQLPTAKLKFFIIKISSDLHFEQKLITLKIPYNKSFAGIYDFKDSAKYASIFPHFLKMIKNNGLIMCHAGMLSNDPKDPIAKCRYDEWDYFMSNQFLVDCQKAGIVIDRFYPTPQGCLK